jgi:hypothetical protein
MTIDQNSAFRTAKYFAQNPCLPVSHSAATGLQEVEQDKWLPVRWRFIPGEHNMLMDRVYLRTQIAGLVKLPMNITRAVRKKAFCIMWLPKTSNPFWPGKKSEGT